MESRQVRTRVLGTRFNVNLRGTTVKVALAEGSVELSGPFQLKTKLNPGEAASIDQEKIEVFPFEESELLGWRFGKLNLKKITLAEVFQTLERYYGVTFETDKKLNLSQSISGSFSNQSLENILQGLAYSLNFNFKINDKNVKIFNNG